MANSRDRVAPTAGNRYTFQTPDRDTPSRASEVPKHTPGKMSGKSTPSAMPTNAALRVRISKKTRATSDPTGPKSGSKKVYVKKPATPAKRNPEYKRRFLGSAKRETRFVGTSLDAHGPHHTGDTHVSPTYDDTPLAMYTTTSAMINRIAGYPKVVMA
jgi:hypothetical protein